MGRTVPSITQAIRMFQKKWAPYRKRLNKEEKETFDEVFDIVVSQYRSACMMACNPKVMEVVFMAILLDHYKKIAQLKKQN